MSVILQLLFSYMSFLFFDKSIMRHYQFRSSQTSGLILSDIINPEVNNQFLPFIQFA